MAARVLTARNIASASRVRSAEACAPCAGRHAHGRRMGSDRITVKNLKVVHIDPDENVMYVSGAIPGRRGTLVEIVAKSKIFHFIIPWKPPYTISQGKSTGKIQLPEGDFRLALECRPGPRSRPPDEFQFAHECRPYQDPRRSLRRRQEALAAEGHRPRPSRLDSLARSGSAAVSPTVRATTRISRARSTRKPTPKPCTPFFRTNSKKEKCFSSMIMNFPRQRPKKPKILDSLVQDQRI